MAGSYLATETGNYKGLQGQAELYDVSKHEETGQEIEGEANGEGC